MICPGIQNKKADPQGIGLLCIEQKIYSSASWKVTG